MYLDLLILTNMGMNFLLLWVTARLAGRELRLWRFAGGALLGACYVLLVFHPSRDFFFSVIAVIILSWIVVLVSFWPFKIREGLLIWVFFFIASFIMGGAIFALSSFLKPVADRGVAQLAPPYGITLIVAGAFVFILVSIIWPYIEHQRWSRIMQAELLVEHAGKAKIIPAIVDTGNQLIEPVSGHPVIIVNYQELKNFLPEQIYNYFKNRKNLNWNKLEQILACSSFASRFHVIPFNSVGVEEGLILGFRPDRIRILVGGKEVTNSLPAVIGICQNYLGVGGVYHALVPPKLVQTGG